MALHGLAPVGGRPARGGGRRRYEPFAEVRQAFSNRPGLRDEGDEPYVAAAIAPQREHAPHGNFRFDVIESFNAKDEGDTPGHIGRGGRMTLHPRVALGDSVHHRRADESDHEIGAVTGVIWCMKHVAALGNRDGHQSQSLVHVAIDLGVSSQSHLPRHSSDLAA